MDNTTAAKLAPLWVALLAFFFIRGLGSDAFTEVSTYLGILAGAAVALTAWFIARKRGRTEG